MAPTGYATGPCSLHNIVGTRVTLQVTDVARHNIYSYNYSVMMLCWRLRSLFSFAYTSQTPDGEITDCTMWTFNCGAPAGIHGGIGLFPTLGEPRRLAITTRYYVTLGMLINHTICGACR